MTERALARNLAHLIDAATPYRTHQRPLTQRERGPSSVWWVALIPLAALGLFAATFY